MAAKLLRLSKIMVQLSRCLYFCFFRPPFLSLLPPYLLLIQSMPNLFHLKITKYFYLLRVAPKVIGLSALSLFGGSFIAMYGPGFDEKVAIILAPLLVKYHIFLFFFFLILIYFLIFSSLQHFLDT